MNFAQKPCCTPYNKLSYTREPRLTATSVTRSTRYYGHFLWPPGKSDHTFSYKETLVNTATSLLRPIVFGPLVNVLTGFHCAGVTPLTAHSGHLSTMSTFFCTQGDRCGEVRLYLLNFHGTSFEMKM